MSTYEQKLAAYLRRIPQSNQPPQPLRQVVGEDAADVQLLHGCAVLLQGFGIVVLSGPADPPQRCIRASSQTAKYALESIASYIESGLPIIGDWKSRGVERDAALLHNGATFLHALEERRSTELDSPRPARQERVAQVLIKRENPRTGEPELLFQYDENAGQYQLIGGRWRESDGDDVLQTMLREIEEELSASRLRYPEDYRLEPVARDMKLPAVLSPTFGALTEYHFWVYHMTGLSRPLVLQPGDRWVPVWQVRAGGVIVEHGERVPFNMTDLYETLQRRLPAGLEGLASSFRTS